MLVGVGQVTVPVRQYCSKASRLQLSTARTERGRIRSAKNMRFAIISRCFLQIPRPRLLTHSLTHSLPKNTPHAESNHCSVQFSSVQFTIISGKGDNTAVPPAHLVHPTPLHSSPALIQTGSRESPHLTTHLLREVDLFRERAELS